MMPYICIMNMYACIVLFLLAVLSPKCLSQMHICGRHVLKISNVDLDYYEIEK